MNDARTEAHSAEDARREAEYHREQIAQALHVLGGRLSERVQQAESTFGKPLDWARNHPYLALGIAVGLGAALSGSSRTVKHRRTLRATRELEHAYWLGRKDEQTRTPPRENSWDDSLDVLRRHYGSRDEWRRGLWFSLLQPAVQQVAFSTFRTLVERLRGHK